MLRTPLQKAGRSLLLHPAMFCWLVCVVNLLHFIPVTAHGGPSIHPICNESQALSFAFARVSPIQVFDTPDLKTGHIEMEFGRAYPVTQKERGKVRLCIKGNNHWVKRSHIVLNEFAEWAIVSQNDLTKRPKVQLWRSQERLSAYLTGYNLSKTLPDYEEFLTDSLPPAPIQFPVYQRDFMEMQIGYRQIEVASLLIPFPIDAIRKYHKLQLDKKKQRNTTLAILVDVNCSTLGFIDLFLNLFKETYTKFKLPMLDNIMLLEFGGDNSVSKPKILSFKQLSNYSWRVRSNPQKNRENNAVLNAISLAAKQLKQQEVRPPLLVLADGDVDMQAIKDLDAFRETWAIKLTPDISTGFLEFLTEDMVKKIELGKIFQKPLNYLDIANIFVQMGMLPLLPNNLDTEELATPPTFVSKESDWFAINLWTVVNGQLLKFKVVPQ